LPEEVRHIDLLTEVVHRFLHQFEVIHVELLLLLACSLGSHVPESRRDDFYFQRSSFDFFLVTSSTRDLSSWSSITDSELRFHRTELNFAGVQRDYFIIMTTEVPVRSYGDDDVFYLFFQKQK